MKPQSLVPTILSLARVTIHGGICRASARLICAALLGAGVVIGVAGTSFAQSFGGAFEGMAQSDEPIQIEADRLEVQDGKGTAVFEGNVAVVQGSTILKTSQLQVFYARDGNSNAPGGNVQKIVASGKVAVRSGDQMASADNAVVDMQAQRAVLSGNVIVSQGESVLEGCTLTINMATNAANLTPCKSASGGRVRGVFTPSSN